MYRLLALMVAVLVGAPMWTAPPAQAASTGALVGLTPTRIVDTRYGTGAPRHQLATGSTLQVQVTGRAGVPASGVDAVVVNLTATAPAAGGYLTAWATGAGRPASSVLNYGRGQTIANQAVVAVGTNGRISIYTQATTDLIVDVTAYYPSGASYAAITPARLLDTRAGARPAAGSTTTLAVTGRGGVPSSGVAAVVLNLTTTQAAAVGYAVAWPAGAARPTASTVNYPAGASVAGMSITKVGSGGAISVYTQRSAHLVVDVVGWFSTGSDYHPVGPSRLVDTRNGTGAPHARVAAGGSLQVQVTGVAGVPTAGVAAVELTVTAVGPAAAGWLIGYPAGSARPGTSILNFPARTTRANSITMKVGSAGRVSLSSTSSTDLVVDIVGYFGTTAGSGWRQVSAGGGYSCGVTVGGGAWCWGANSSGQLGNGGTTDSTVPVPVSGLGSGVASISAGWYHTCAVLTSGAARCWGANTSGNLGNGTTTDSTVPVPVSGLTGGVAQISVAGWHTCAVLTSGAARCWGYNPYGELGNGTTTDSSVPVPVSGLSGAISISAGWDQNCAVLSGGAARCWGYNADGELGNGTRTSSATPVGVSGLSSGVSTISAGSWHTCAVLTSGAARCWGANAFGNLGNGTTTAALTPVGVSGLSSGVSTIAAGASYATCAVLVGGAARCWGYNAQGTLGNGTTTNSPTPVPVSGLSSQVTAISTGSWHSCAVLATGEARCWGYNRYGGLGNGTTSNSTVPVTVTGGR